MLNIGCHLSSAKGYLHMGEEALALGANTFQFFTRNPRGGRAKAIDTEDIRALLALMRENSFAPLLAHAPYTLNACSADSNCCPSTLSWACCCAVGGWPKALSDLCN